MLQGSVKHGKTFIWYLTALALIISACLLTGVTFARYRSIYRSAGTVEMQYNYSNTGIYMLSPSSDENGEPTPVPSLNETEDAYLKPGNWTLVSEDNGEYKLSFILSNESIPSAPADFDQTGYLQIFITEGIVSSSAITVTLECEGTAYTAVGSPVEEGTPAYNAYGPGWLYKFYNVSDEETGWFLKGGIATDILMTLNISGAPEYPAAVTLKALSRPA
ncbi:MAG: hypothetical protein IJS94_06150 [Clostridia bacterium]|nr:hypothetical protein [Clostridia bacterium]